MLNDAVMFAHNALKPPIKRIGHGLDVYYKVDSLNRALGSRDGSIWRMSRPLDPEATMEQVMGHEFFSSGGFSDLTYARQYMFDGSLFILKAKLYQDVSV